MEDLSQSVRAGSVKSYCTIGNLISHVVLQHVLVLRSKEQKKPTVRQKYGKEKSAAAVAATASAASIDARVDVGRDQSHVHVAGDGYVEGVGFRFDQIYADDGVRWCASVGWDLSMGTHSNYNNLMEVRLDSLLACQR